MIKSVIRVGQEQTIEKTAKELRKYLRKGDIVISGPIALNIKTRFFNIIAMATKKVCRGVTHACLYLGNGKVLDIDAKFIRIGYEVEKITLEQFITNKVSNFGGVKLYAITHKNYTMKKRNKVVQQSIENFYNRRSKVRLSYIKTLITGLRYLFLRNKKYPEDLSQKNLISCAEMVAHSYKSAGVNVGRKASYNYLPSHFMFSKNFKINRKILVK